MKVTGKNTSLVGVEGESPPLPFVTVSAEEGASLIARGYAKEYDEDEIEVREPDVQFDVSPEVAKEPESVAEPDAPDEVSQETAPSDPAAAQPSVGVTDGEAAGEAGESQAEPAADPAAARLQEIADHIHLLSEDDLVKTGARAGKARVDVLTGALGYPVTAEDVDAAMALETGQ